PTTSAESPWESSALKGSPTKTAHSGPTASAESASVLEEWGAAATKGATAKSAAPEGTAAHPTAKPATAHAATHAPDAASRPGCPALDGIDGLLDEQGVDPLDGDDLDGSRGRSRRFVHFVDQGFDVLE